jgi:hypothetical protein
VNVIGDKRVQCHAVLVTSICIAVNYYYYYYLTAIRLTPGGSSTHLHTNSTQNTADGTHMRLFQNEFRFNPEEVPLDGVNLFLTVMRHRRTDFGKEN